MLEKRIAYVYISIDVSCNALICLEGCSMYMLCCITLHVHVHMGYFSQAPQPLVTNFWLSSA